jgi:hypothetical protein
MKRSTARFGFVPFVLALLSGCAVSLEPMEARERIDPGSSSGSDARTEPEGQAGSEAAGAAGAAAGIGGSSSSGGSGGAAGAAGAPPETAAAGAANSSGAGLCPLTTEYALKYFEARNADTELAPCTESSCAAGECCWRNKACVAL